MSKISTMKRNILSGAAICGVVVGVTLGGVSTASAAPAGYAGPFDGPCKGSLVRTIGLPDSVGQIQVWYDSSGSGTYCAKTYDNRSGQHRMEIRLRHWKWATSWNDTGLYDTYAGGIYVSEADTQCAYVSGWVEVNGTRYTRSETLVCETS
ncbi:hypothetical protein [Streptomyces sp. B1I3]|uniref:hypothetical protein n=1 Tax=Streptomyces sp. B1I3 TaxID=3042264 RepID=UPI00277FF330|nr:hypothetical protein [Streptomyces sp. B1I3]MDQ0794983.1 hypothetical protein [Streptomyces sp. B1I3]